MDSLARAVWPQTFWPQFSAGEDSLAKPRNILYTEQLDDKHITNVQIYKLFCNESINYTKKRKEEIIIKNPGKFDLQNGASVHLW